MRTYIIRNDRGRVMCRHQRKATCTDGARADQAILALETQLQQYSPGCMQGKNQLLSCLVSSAAAILGKAIGFVSLQLQLAVCIFAVYISGSSSLAHSPNLCLILGN